MSDERSPALRMEGVRRTFRSGDDEVVAVSNVDLTVGADEIVALVGPSGSGKTTLCSIAGGLLRPTAGTVVVGGRDISGYSAKELTDFRRTSVGFVFQTVNLVGSRRRRTACPPSSRGGSASASRSDGPS